MIDNLKLLRDAHTALREECEDAGCLHSSYGALLSGITAIISRAETEPDYRDAALRLLKDDLNQMREDMRARRHSMQYGSSEQSDAGNDAASINKSARANECDYWIPRVTAIIDRVVTDPDYCGAVARLLKDDWKRRAEEAEAKLAQRLEPDGTETLAALNDVADELQRDGGIDVEKALRELDELRAANTWTKLEDGVELPECAVEAIGACGYDDEPWAPEDTLALATYWDGEWHRCLRTGDKMTVQRLLMDGFTHFRPFVGPEDE